MSMPRYKSNERDENGGAVYKDICNPITAEFREELYGNILETYEQERAGDSMTDKEKRYRAYFLNVNGKIDYYEQCKGCVHSCKQSFRISELWCKKFRASELIVLDYGER